MKIETLTNLIGGKLLNRPFISEVVNFTDELKEVSRGSCFFAKNRDEIKEAISKGAYAVVFKDDFPILDNEIAWVKIEDFKLAVFNLFKYEALKKKIYFTDKITASLIKKMSNEKELIVIDNDFENFLKAINKTYIITSNKKFLDLFPNIEKISFRDIELIQKGIFKSIFNGIEINLPYVYKEYFAKAINFFETYSLKYHLDFELDRFKPIFINSRFEEVEYGRSERVLIVGIRNDEFFIEELNYFIANTKHAKSLVIDEIHKHYLNERFNFALIVDFEVELRKKEEKGLFDD